MKLSAILHHETAVGQYANEVARDLKERKRGVINTSAVPDLPIFKRDKDALTGFDNPILTVDEKGKVILDRYWDVVATGYSCERSD